MAVHKQAGNDDRNKHEEDTTKSTVNQDFSIFTAASESEFRNNLQSYATRFESSYPAYGVPTPQQLARQNALLKRRLTRVRLCTLISIILIGCFLLVDIVSANVASTVCSFLFIVAIAFFSEWGCQQKDWRPLVALFVFCFIIVAYSSAHFIVNCLQFVSELALLNLPQYKEYAASGHVPLPTILFPVHLLLLIFELSCVIFWAYTVYTIEQSIRLILDIADGRGTGSHSSDFYSRVSKPEPVSSIPQQLLNSTPVRAHSVIPDNSDTAMRDHVLYPIDKYSCTLPPRLMKDDTQCSSVYQTSTIQPYDQSHEALHRLNEPFAHR